MHKDGPRSGEAYPFGAILISQDMFALDNVAARLADMDPAQLPIAAASGYDQTATVVGDEMMIRQGFEAATPQSIHFTPTKAVKSALKSLLARAGYRLKA